LKIKPSFLAVFLLITTLISVSLRTVQFIFAIEPRTGFYIPHSVSVTSLNIVIFAVCIFFAVMFFMLKNEEIENTSPLLLRFGSMTMFSLSLLSIFFFFQIVLNLIDVYDGLLKGEYTQIFLLIFAIITTVFFVNILRYKNDYIFKSSYPLMVLAPLCYNLIRLIVTFIKYTGIANISSRLFEITMLSFFVLFFLSYAKVTGNKGNKKSMFIFGSLAIYFALLNCLPQLILINKPSDMDTFTFIFNMALDLIIAMFIGVVILTKDKEIIDDLEEYDEFEELE
jgi:hypothetical protein